MRTWLAESAVICAFGIAGPPSCSLQFSIQAPMSTSANGVPSGIGWTAMRVRESKPAPASGRDLHLLLHFLGLEVRDQRVDHGLDAAVHEVRQLVRGEADAMIGNAVLREVVGADLLAAIAAAHHRPALLGQRVLLLLLFHFVQDAKRCHGIRSRAAMYEATKEPPPGRRRVRWRAANGRNRC